MNNASAGDAGQLPTLLCASVSRADFSSDTKVKADDPRECVKYIVSAVMKG